MRRFFVILLAFMLCLTCVMPVADAAAKQGVVRTSSGAGVNLRASAGGVIKGWVPEGTRVVVVSTVGNWARVRVLGKWAAKNGYNASQNTGFIYSSYVSYNGKASSYTASNGKTVPTGNVVSQIGGTGNAARLKYGVTVRSGAGNGYKSKGTLGGGTSIVVNSTRGSWLKITAKRNGKTITGFVPKAAVSKGTSARVTAAVNMRTGGSTHFSSICTVSNGANVTLLYVGSSWSQIRWNGKVGYVSNNYLKIK